MCIQTPVVFPCTHASVEWSFCPGSTFDPAKNRTEPCAGCVTKEEETRDKKCPFGFCNYGLFPVGGYWDCCKCENRGVLSRIYHPQTWCNRFVNSWEWLNDEGPRDPEGRKIAQDCAHWGCLSCLIYDANGLLTTYGRQPKKGDDRDKKDDEDKKGKKGKGKGSRGGSRSRGRGSSSKGSSSRAATQQSTEQQYTPQTGY